MFTVNTSDPSVNPKGDRILETFTRLTGGASFGGQSAKAASKAFATIHGLIDSMYLLSYVPPEPSKAAVHEVEIKPAPHQRFELLYARKYHWNL